MSVKPLFNNLELRFWNTVIPLMQNSSFLHRVLPWLYREASLHLNLKNLLVVFTCMISGVSLGFILGILSQFR